MAEFDPSRDEDTKIIQFQAKESVEPDSSVVILPDGTKPVPLGSGVVTGLLGEGGMSIVYKIWNEQLGVQRAVKLLRPTSTQEQKERFDREVKITAQLDHPNIIDIHAVGEWNGLPYIEMEMVDGVSLAELIERQGALPLEVCVSISIIICRALKYTHNHKYLIDNKTHVGILHRDLKPGNILISRDGIVRLSDFGVATPTNIEASASSGKVIGSMQYLAPEQLEEDDIDIRADIYSFGCILYEMLSGERAFPDRNVTRLVRRRLKNEFKPLTSFPITAPSKLKNLVNQCLLLDVTKRPENVDEVLEELENIHDSQSSTTADEIVLTYVTGKKPKHESVSIHEEVTGKNHFTIMKIIGLLLIVLAIGAFGFYLLITNSGSNEPTALADRGIAEQAKKSPTQAPKVAPTARKREPTLNIASAKQITTKRNERPRLINKPPAKVDQIKKTPPKRKPAPVVKKEPPTKKDLKKPTKPKVEQKEAQPPVVAPSNLEPTQDQPTENQENILESIRKAAAANNHEVVLEQFNKLSSDQSRLKEARLHKMRALIGLNKADKLYFDGNHINDGEFYLAKAKYLYGIKQHQQAAWILGIARSSPALLINKSSLNIEITYYLAKCKTSIYYESQTPSNKVTAMKSWFKVKNEFRNNQKHAYFHEANKNIRELGKNE